MPPLYLIADLPAELDEAHCASVCAQLRGGRQVIMTAVDRASLERAWGADPHQFVPRGTWRPHYPAIIALKSIFREVPSWLMSCLAKK